MLQTLFEALQGTAPICTRSAAIIKVERDAKTYLGLVEGYLRTECKEMDVSNAKSLEVVQQPAKTVK